MPGRDGLVDDVAVGMLPGLLGATVAAMFVLPTHALPPEFVIPPAIGI